MINIKKRNNKNELENKVIEELRDSWVNMFTHIDDIVEDIVKTYPEFSAKINRDIIHKAVRNTQKLDSILEQKDEEYLDSQENLFPK